MYRWDLHGRNSCPKFQIIRIASKAGQVTSSSEKPPRSSFKGTSEDILHGQ